MHHCHITKVEDEYSLAGRSRISRQLWPGSVNILLYMVWLP